ncbi:MAG: hypothetical protein WDN28_30290 [Chthoniobacter sp.]
MVAQMMGNDIPGLVRAAKELEQHPVAAIDLNLGCRCRWSIANAPAAVCCAIRNGSIPSSARCGKR